MDRVTDGRRGTTRDVYERLAEALSRHPEGFPRTSTGVELQILRRIFSREEAELGALLTHRMEAVPAIAARAGVDARTLRARLAAMMAQGKVWGRRHGPGRPWSYRMAPFIPGFYEEYMAATRDMEVLHLMWHYAHEGALEIAGFRPALHRVLPALKSLDGEQILPYDDVRAIIMEAKSFAAFDCTCRLTRDMEGNRPCSFPVHNCLQMFYERRAPGPGTISRQKALEILDEAEELGLVHTGTNYIREMHWICNCCGCCCNLIRNLVEEGLDGAIAGANYRAVAANGTCTACGACVDRCPVKAIRLDGSGRFLESSRCIGCGLCVTGCPVGALALRRRAPGDIRHPPLDEDDFAKRRLRGRERAAKRQP